jgi:glyoxylate/hydroxypyruvate reductase A
MAILLATNFEAHEQAQWLALLRAELPDEPFVAEREPGDGQAIDIALVANPLPGALLGLPRLVLIQSLWAGVERLLADPDIPVQVPLARLVDPAMNDAMAQTALWAVLGLHRDFLDYVAQQRERQWRQLPQRRAEEIAVAVLGLGEMGRAVALRLAANGYRVSGWSTRAAELPPVRTRHGVDALPQLLGQVQIVVNLLPLTPATRGLFDARVFAQMQRGACLVNLARGAHVVDADLIDALDRGHLHRALLDVFHAEPLPAEHPFWTHPRITVLPHTAAQTDPRTAAAIVARNVRALRAGQPLAGRVDRTRGY